MSNPNDLRADAAAQLDMIQRFSKEDALEHLKNMDPTLFENLTAVLFERRGYRTETVGTSGDEGVDVLLHRDTELSVVQCKRYDGSVGQPTVRDLFGTMIHNKAAEAYLVTTGSITHQAREWAFGKPIRLIDGFTLVDLIMSLYAAPPTPRQQTTQQQTSQQRTRPSQPAVATSSSSGSRRWLWPAVILFFIVFGAAVGLAYTTVANRWTTEPAAIGESTRVAVGGSNDAPAASADGDETPEPAETSADATPTLEATPTWTVVPPTPTPCPQNAAGQFSALYSSSALGCATSGANVVWAAWEPFEHGGMLWRSDTNIAYAFYGTNQGRWFPIKETWDGQPMRDRGAPPPGLQLPARGFGYVWSVSDELFGNLGWARDKEKGFCAEVQNFGKGFILRSSPVGSCTPDNLYNQAQAGDWQPVSLVAYGGERWNAANPGAVSAPDGSASEREPDASAANARPSAQGLFSATNATGITLDGNLVDWRGEWLPIGSVVAGRDKFAGENDLSAVFQMRWTQSDLYVAVSVTDDTHRAGPSGTNMWQGDGLEIHLDRELSADFSENEMSADDYQIGVSFGPNLHEIRGYRWIPTNKESALGLDGSVRETDQRYDVEVRIPWATFDVEPSQLHAGVTFGFNLSVNDNDDAEPAQQTVISASPKRTNHETPTEWGTLILR